MANDLSDGARALFDAKTFVTLGTLNSDGSPQLSVVWVARDGDDLLMSTVIGRRKERNLRADPRVSVMAVNPENPYQYVEVRGRAAMTEEGGRELIDSLAEKYTGVRPYANDGPGDRRVVIRVSPGHVVARG
jgi:PPOX class probable F420-dependent enzyme